MTPEQIDDLTVKVYRARLDASCSGDADRQVVRDGDGGLKQRARAMTFRPVVLETCAQLGLYTALGGSGKAKEAPPATPAARKGKKAS